MRDPAGSLPEDHRAHLAMLPEPQRLALYGAMLALATADGALDLDAAAVIYGQFDLAGFSQDGRRQVHGFLLAPPSVRELLAPLRAAADQARFGSMILLIEIAGGDVTVENQKRARLRVAQAALGVTDEQLQSLVAFVATAQMLRHRAADHEVAAKAMRRAASRLRAVGIPIADPATSASLLRLHAAGLTSGLTLVGLGLGAGAGLGVSAGCGVIGYLAALRLLRAQRPRAPGQSLRARRSQVLQANLNNSIAVLEERIFELKRRTEGGERGPGKEPLASLTRHLAALKELWSRQGTGPAGEGTEERALAGPRRLDAPAGPRLSYSDIRKSIQDADVLMFRGSHPISRMFQAGARSSYSHCGLVV